MRLSAGTSVVSLAETLHADLANVVAPERVIVYDRAVDWREAQWRHHSTLGPAPLSHSGRSSLMDNRIYEKGSRAEKLWVVLVGLVFGLGLVWVAGA